VRGLRQVGYPLRPNDLEMEEWYDLIELEAAINEQRNNGHRS
jgi:hypothetical protein